MSPLALSLLLVSTCVAATPAPKYESLVPLPLPNVKAVHGVFLQGKRLPDSAWRWDAEKRILWHPPCGDACGAFSVLVTNDTPKGERAWRE